MGRARKTAIILESLVCFGPVALLLPWAVFLLVLQAVPGTGTAARAVALFIPIGGIAGLLGIGKALPVILGDDPRALSRAMMICICLGAAAAGAAVTFYGGGIVVTLLALAASVHFVHIIQARAGQQPFPLHASLIIASYGVGAWAGSDRYGFNDSFHIAPHITVHAIDAKYGDLVRAVAEIPPGSPGDRIRSRLAADPAILQVRVSYEGAEIPAGDPFLYWSVVSEHESCVRESFERAMDRLIRCRMTGKAGTWDVLSVKTELKQAGKPRTQIELKLDYDLIERDLRSK